MVAAINGEVAGMLATSPCTSEQITSLSAQFRLGMPLPCDCLEAPQQHAQVDACLISPVFAAQTGTLLAGVLVAAAECGWGVVVSEGAHAQLCSEGAHAQLCNYA